MSPNRTCGKCKHFCPSDEGTCEFGQNHEWGFSDDDVCENFSAKCSVGEAVQELKRLKSENKKLKAIIRKIKMHCEEEEQYSSIMRSGAYSSILRIINTGDVVL